MTLLPRSTRGRVAVLGVLVLLAGGGVTWSVLNAVHEEQRRREPTPQTTRDLALDLDAVLAAPHIVFRSTAPGPTYGMLAAVPLDDPAGDRAASDLSCERVYAVGSGGICLQADRGVTTTYKGLLLDEAMQPVHDLELAGAPSRARMSADGSLAASSVFVSGHSYASTSFVTETIIYDTADAHGHGNLEKEFTTVIDGKKVSAADLNVWGVTFPSGPDPTTFYVTIATGGKTWIARGNLAKKTLTAMVEDAACPSLSPDGTKLVYKRTAGSPITWGYHVLDLDTMTETAVAESRSIDDQAEWLDDDNVLYGMPREGTGQTDVWTAPADGTGQPRLFLPDAWSPAVIR